MKVYVAKEDTKLSAFTDDACAAASFCLRTLLKNRDVRVNGVRVSSDVPLRRGDEVAYYLSAAQAARTGFAVLFEDDNVIVADKESGVNSEAVFSALSERGEAHFIHRLDRNTAGLLIFAKNAQAAEELLAAFRTRRVTKEYLALVVGTPSPKHAVLTAYLKKDAVRATVRISGRPVGEKIVTEYEVLAPGDMALLKVTLHTGKTHQIRAHLAHIGHPIVGDEKYGDHAFNRAHHATRQRLIAKSLTLHTEGELAYLAGRTFISAHNF